VNVVILGILLVIALLNGGWMTFDGLHVLRTGKYFGPEMPGPWSSLLRKIRLDPFKMGPVFLFLGFLWFLAGSSLLLVHNAFALWFTAFVSVLTIWYLPVGTILSLITILLLGIFQSELIY
jgi:hypothetical protein